MACMSLRLSAQRVLVVLVLESYKIPMGVIKVYSTFFWFFAWSCWMRVPLMWVMHCQPRSCFAATIAVPLWQCAHTVPVRHEPRCIVPLVFVILLWYPISVTWKKFEVKSLVFGSIDTTRFSYFARRSKRNTNFSGSRYDLEIFWNRFSEGSLKRNQCFSGPWNQFRVVFW